MDRICEGESWTKADLASQRSRWQRTAADGGKLQQRLSSVGIELDGRCFRQ